MRRHYVSQETDIKTLPEATALFYKLAGQVLDLEARDAAFEREIAQLKAAHEQATAALRAGMSSDELRLLRFIQANPGQFQNPRKIATSFGDIGMQFSSELAVTNEQAALRYVVKNKLETCFQVITRLLKPGLKAVIKAGRKIPGCRMRSSDQAVYHVDSVLIKKAREGKLGPREAA